MSRKKSSFIFGLFDDFAKDPGLIVIALAFAFFIAFLMKVLLKAR